jgi:small subunit ribosomal protein S4
MGRHTKATCKLCRREKEKLFLKAEKCFTEKCPFSRRSYPPGQHGRIPVRVSEYGIRLREKQKARRIYGLNESQFEKYFEKASKKKGATGEKLLEFLERRLDNILYRLFTVSRQSARQIIRHGGVLVNDRKVNIPSFLVKGGDTVKIRPKIVPIVKAAMEKFPDHVPPAWLKVTGEAAGEVSAIPKREDIDTILQEHLVVEYYSR